ncbi:MAG TPA: hypothetical protein VJ954_05520 [Ignavibacteriaceae bacterium]|nr:hypothetical protein [Ignavibacteriaceae bacterium]
MKPLIVLLASFIVLIYLVKIINGNYEIAYSARIAMSVMLLFTAFGHFVFSKDMIMMVPNFIPYKRGVIYLTGIIEIFAAVGLIIQKLSVITAWLLIFYLFIVLPANIKASINSIDYQKATNNGNGIKYLWFRIPLQLFFILWIFLSTIVEK